VPIADLVRPMPYPRIYPPEEQGFHPTAASRTLFVDTVDRGGTEAIVAYLAASTAPLRVAQLRVLGGAMARVPAQATAFAHRTSRLMVNLTAVYRRPEDAAAHQAWVDRLAAALRNGDARASVNFLGDEARRGSARPTRGRPGAAGGDQGPLRPHQPVPPQPEHPADQG
jgi:hypothetical protein